MNDEQRKILIAEIQEQHDMQKALWFQHCSEIQTASNLQMLATKVGELTESSIKMNGYAHTLAELSRGKTIKETVQSLQELRERYKAHGYEVGNVEQSAKADIERLLIKIADQLLGIEQKVLLDNLDQASQAS